MGVFVSEREVVAKAFNTCKGEVIIIGVSLEGWGGVLWSIHHVC